MMEEPEPPLLAALSAPFRSGPADIKKEIRRVLRQRLIGVAALLSGGFALFLASDALNDGLVFNINFWLQVGSLAVFVAALLAIKLSDPSLKALRLWEAALFGVAAVEFVVAQHLTLLRDFSGFAGTMILAPWITLIFIYSLFIPSPRWRAALIISGFAALPLVNIALVQFRLDAPPAGFWTIFTGVSLFFAFIAAAAITGSAMIRTMRREAHEARKFGQYELGELLGEGGMGKVYRAEHVLLKRPCALKLILPDRTQIAENLIRFEREVQMTARLAHWNTIEIYDYGRTNDGTFYYVMEHLQGHDLDRILEITGALPPERLVALLTQVCAGLREAHGLGFVHRDIKPSNIIAARVAGLYDIAKIVDFGLAKRQRQEASPRVTEEGFVIGTPHYMSPEQAMGEDDDKVDALSDIYSLGISAYQLATKVLPIRGQKIMEVLINHIQTAPDPLLKWRPEFPSDLAEVIMRCIAKRREDRFQSVDELARALRACKIEERWTQARAEEWWKLHQGPLDQAVKDELEAARVKKTATAATRA